MATSLGIIEERDVVMCDACGLVQFVTATRSCRRCRTPYERAAASPALEPQPTLATAAVASSHSCDFDLASAVLLIRLARGLSQQDLANRISSPRTWISKVETRQTIPTVFGLLKLAQGLEIAPWILVEFASVPGRARELMEEPDRPACSPAHARQTETTFAEAIL